LSEDNWTDEKQARNENEEIFVVPFAYACTDPCAMMVESLYACVALVAVI